MIADTPLKSNMNPKNHALEEELPFNLRDFGVHVRFRGCSNLSCDWNFW